MSGHLEIYNGPYTHTESRHLGPTVISMIPLRTFSDIQLDHVNTQKVDTSAAPHKTSSSGDDDDDDNDDDDDDDDDDADDDD